MIPYCGLRHKVLKVGRILQTILQQSLTQDLSLRGVLHIQNLNDNHLHSNLFLPAPIFGDPSEKQSHPKKHCAKNIVLKVLQT